MLDKKWTLGFKDRGMGHGDFAVIVEGTEKLVVEAPNKEVAEHIVEAHNFAIAENMQVRRCGDCRELLPDGHPHGYCPARDEPDYF